MYQVDDRVRACHAPSVPFKVLQFARLRLGKDLAFVSFRAEQPSTFCANCIVVGRLQDGSSGEDQEQGCELCRGADIAANDENGRVHKKVNGRSCKEEQQDQLGELYIRHDRAGVEQAKANREGERYSRGPRPVSIER